MSEIKSINKQDLEKESLSTLRALGRRLGVESPASKNKDLLISEIMAIKEGEKKPVKKSNRGAPVRTRIDLSKFFNDTPSYDDGYDPSITTIQVADVILDKETTVTGVFEDHSQGYGFLREVNSQIFKKGVYVAKDFIVKYNLRRGDEVQAVVKGCNEKTNAPALKEILLINGRSPESYFERKNFDELTPCYPKKRIKLENQSGDIALRIIDLFAPIGFGQRGLIVAPPKTGKTTILQKIAKAIEDNYSDVHLIVLLIDERPEEVTDFKCAIKSEVVYSTFDESAERHIKTAENTIAKAKRLVEEGKDVVILLDSITRLARAYNTAIESSGKTLSGGLDPTAMYGPKSFFGSARNTTDGGSLTILATALIETGSRLDEVIFEEFKGTGNMEIHLSNALAERRIFPAIDLKKSGTRKEELLLDQLTLDSALQLRRPVLDGKITTEELFQMVKKSKDNQDLCEKADAWLNILNK